MSKITLKINGTSYKVDGRFGPDVSLAEFIRKEAGLTGTKTMCQEGGCGACVVVARTCVPPGNQMQTFSVNSCLVSVLSCHNWEVTTVEGIGNRTDGYHDIQRRLATFNGSQCGYCTPGWICSMYSIYESNKPLTTAQVENSFAGNMCRCTGYRPIADAFKTFATDMDDNLKKKLIDLEDLDMFKPCGVQCAKKCLHKDDKKSCKTQILNACDTSKSTNNDEVDNKVVSDSKQEVIDSLNNITIDKDDEKNDWCIIEDVKMIELDCGTTKWLTPYNLSDTFKAMGRSPSHKLIAGNTGQGVYHVTDYPENIVDISNVAELKGYVIDVNLILGAGMTLSEMMEVFLKLSSEGKDFSYLKQLHEHMDLVAHIPVRNIGTIGGNLFMKYENKEFQSDLFLIFETVGGMVTISEAPNKTKTISLQKLLKIDMKNKIILNVLLPPLSQCCLVKTYKIMPRSQNAHAVVNAGFLFRLKPNSQKVEKANIVFGGISPKFVHASKTESLLKGKELFSETTLQLALKSLEGEVKPVEAPPEPSATYRKMLALALFYKAILHLCPTDKLNPKYRSGGDALKRKTSQGTQVFDTDKTVWPISQPIPKLEALVQCSGEATFANDLPTQKGEVFGAFVTADSRPGSVIISFDASEALKISGVIAFYTAKDIPGANTFTPKDAPLIVFEEEILCSEKVLFYGQPVGIVVADREKTANKAASLVKVTYSCQNNKKPLLTTEDVLSSPEKEQRIYKDRAIEPKETGKDVKTTIYGKILFPSQYHYTMEPQTCVVRPTEDGYEVYSSTQWLDLTNIAVAKCIGVPVNSVNVIVRRVGGAYGAKITRSSQIACAAAIVTRLTGKTCRFVLSIEANMRIVGKRLPTQCDFELGTNSEGEIQYMKTKYYQENGCSANETISGLTLQHIVNCYDPSRWLVESNSVATDVPSNTWCRAPASTEGVAMIEHMMERIAYTLKKDPLEVRLLNMATGENPIPELIDQLKRDSQYDERFAEVIKFNNENRWRKRAIKLIPMTYEIFYLGPYNAIINIYHADGSIVLTHGGIEMGQGINTKVAQVCAYTLGVPLEKVSVKFSSSFTSPNSIATGASIGSECVAYATMKACNIILERLKPIREKFGNVPWEEIIKQAFYAGVELQATAQYSLYDDVKIYDIYGVVVMEVEVDILTGNHDVRRVDLLEDVGRSLSPMIDVAQIEGAFVMGLGYWTSEKLEYDRETGRILTDRTWTYKPPGIKDIPADFRVYFRRNTRNPFGVLQSKATGEPALCLAVSITHAIREAVRAARLDAGHEDQWLDINNPYTVENIFMAAGHKIEHFKLN